MNSRPLSLVLSFVVLASVAMDMPRASAQDDIDRPPISYSTAPVTDAIQRLQARLDAGKEELKWDPRHGWLPSLLELLEVPQSSQTLVFSKTSLQISKISPDRPRALYFSDDVYVGTVQFGDLVELSAVDPEQGAIFYSIDQSKNAAPRLVRDKAKCLSCHHNSRTRGVPGYLVRSVFTQQSGHPRFDLGSTTTDLSTPFRKQFGGWYVTGTHGKMEHRGNAIVAGEGDDLINPHAAANVTDLSKKFDTSRYLTPHSDLVAILVLEHQSQLHNAMTLASYEARRAKHYDNTWNDILEQPPGYQSDVSKRRISAAGDALVEALLHSGEYQLTSPIAGTSDFAKQFAAAGPRDSQGRSLREFDLQTRLFKYPCSYLIYSDSFASLPSAMREYVDAKLVKVLTGEDKSEEFSHLTVADRKAIGEILAETLSGFELD